MFQLCLQSSQESRIYKCLSCDKYMNILEIMIRYSSLAVAPVKIKYITVTTSEC